MVGASLDLAPDLRRYGSQFPKLGGCLGWVAGVTGWLAGWIGWLAWLAGLPKHPPSAKARPPARLPIDVADLMADWVARKMCV